MKIEIGALSVLPDCIINSLTYLLSEKWAVATAYDKKNSHFMAYLRPTTSTFTEKSLLWSIFRKDAEIECTWMYLQRLHKRDFSVIANITH